MNKSWEELGKRKSQLEEKRSVLRETAGFFNEASRVLSISTFGNRTLILVYRLSIDTPRSGRLLTTETERHHCSSMLPSTVTCPERAPLALISSSCPVQSRGPGCRPLSASCGES